MATYKRLETSIERAAAKKIKELGGAFIKIYPYIPGIPDRELLKAKGKMAFIEMKRPGEVPTKLQRHRHDELRGMGFDVYVCASVECVVGIYKKL